MARYIWNRCDYCGRFISLDEFDNGSAERNHYYGFSATATEPPEEVDTFHVACRSRDDARYAAITAERGSCPVASHDAGT